MIRRELCLVATFFVAACATADRPHPPEDGKAGGKALDVPPASPAEVEAGFKLLEQVLSTYPRDGFEPAALAPQLREPEAAARWVREHTRLVAYRGRLRGAAGVLVDRYGNSLDRALLVAELVRLNGGRARLANATLDDAQLRVVNEATLRTSTLPPAGADPSVPKGLEEMDADLARSVERARDAELAVIQEMQEESARQVQSLSASAGLSQGAPPVSEPLRDHWWPQIERAGSWIDLDPTSATPIAGLTASRTVDIDKLDRTLDHEVAIRVVVERWENGRFVERTPFEQTLTPANLSGKGVQIGFTIRNPTRPATVRGATSLRSYLLSADEWLPVLVIDGKGGTQQAFSDTGELRAKVTTAANRAGEGASKDLGALGGALLPPTSSAPPAVAGSVLSAAWLEFTVTAPGSAPRVIRRELFDLVGPAARKQPPAHTPTFSEEQRLRRALGLTTMTDLAILGAQPSAAQVAYSIGRATLDARPLWLGDEAAKAKFQRENQRQRIGGPAWTLALARAELGEIGTRAYLDRPNILSLRSLVLGDNFARCGDLDIVANDVAVLPEAAERASEVRLRQGVVDTNAEARVGTRCGPGENTARLAQATGGRGWLTLRSERDPNLAKLVIDADSRSRIEDDLRAGNIVIAPSAPIDDRGVKHFAWWRIAKTGTTLGIDSHGHGGDLLEEVDTMVTAIDVIDAFVCMACATTGERRAECAKEGIKSLAQFAVGGLVGASFVAKATKEAQKAMLFVLGFALKLRGVVNASGQSAEEREPCLGGPRTD